MRHGDGTLCFPNGDKISGEFSKDEIYKATFTKGSYSMVSRFTCDLILANSDPGKQKPLWQPKWPVP